MEIAVIMHVESEGPGTLGTFLSVRGANLNYIRLYDGDSLPNDTRGIDAILCMGGPMNVYEHDKYPFLAGEMDFLRTALKSGTPMLGVCLGAQLLAVAGGAEVIASPEKEIGWGTVTLTGEGKADPLFAGLPEELEVFQWHGDMFRVPEGGVLLASSAQCPNQAFRFGRAYGLQFHVEVTADILTDWFSHTDEVERMVGHFGEIQAVLTAQAETLYENFLRMIA